MNAPDIKTVLQVVADLISAEHPIAPTTESTGYGTQQLMRAPMMLQAIAEEHDRAAHWRAEENQAMRRLFAQAAVTVGDPDLRQRLTSAAHTRDTDLRVSSLDRNNDGLRRLLIELHAWVQHAAGNTAGDTAAAALDAAIWQELRASTERRRSALDRF